MAKKKARPRTRISDKSTAAGGGGASKGRGARGRGPATPIVQKTGWDLLAPRTQHLICLGVLLVVTLGFFASVTFGGKTLIGGDTVGWRGMAESALEYKEQTGNEALWVPNAFGGMPSFMVHYPPAVPQADSLLKQLRQLGWWPTAHFFALLLGTYFLVFYLTRDALASALAAVAFGLTTYLPLILLAGHNTKFIALAYAPWLLLAYAYAMRRPPGADWMRMVLAGLLFAIALAVNLRAGHVQITYYIAFTLGVLWIVEGVQAVREGEARAFLGSTLALAGGGLLALVMVAQPYLITAEYKAFTIRSAGESGGLAWDYAMNWSQGWGELVTLIVADAYGGSGQTYWGAKPFTSGPHYVGIVVVVLAALALVSVRRRVVWGLGVAAGLMTLFALGENFALLNRPMFAFFPLFDAFRVPETWLAAVALALAVLAGFGAYYLNRREPTPEGVERKTRVTYLTLGVAGGLLLVLFLGQGWLFSFEREGEQAQIEQAVAAQAGVEASDPRVVQFAREAAGELRDERAGRFRKDLMRSLLFLAAAAALVVLQRQRRIPGWAMQAGLLLLVLVDLWQVDRRYFNAESPALQNRAEVEAQIPEYGFDRFVKARVEVAGGPGHFRTLPLALNPFNDGRTPYHYESVGGYSGAKLTLFQRYIDHVLTNPDGSLNANGLDLLATRYVIARQPAPGLETVYTDEQTGLLVLENPSALPRAFLAEETRVVEGDEETWRVLRDPATDLRQTAILAEPLPEPLAAAPIDSSSTARVSLVRFTPREIVWEVETDRPRLLVANEVYYPAGWHASIGGEAVPIHRVHYLLRGVRIPEGRHIVAMRFDPPRHELGLRLSTLGTAFAYLAALLVAGLLWYRKGEG